MGDVENTTNNNTLVAVTKIGSELGKWFAGATALEVLAGTRTDAARTDRSVILGPLFNSFSRQAAIPTYGITSTVLYGTSAILKAAYKL
jgi:hypothetical protein